MFNSGFKNTISLYGLTLCDSVLVESKYGKYDYNDNSFTCKLGLYIEKRDYLKVFVVMDTSKSLIFESDLIWKNIPLPKVVLPGDVSDTISYQTLQVLKSLKIKKDNLFVNDIVFKIQSFQVTVEIDDRIESFMSYSSEFTDEQKKAFSELKNGSFFYIENIMIKDPSGLVRESEILKFYVKKTLSETCPSKR